MLGLYQGGREVVADSVDQEWARENFNPPQVGSAAQQAVLDAVTDYFLIGYAGLLGLVLAARGLRAVMERRAGMISLSYGNGPNRYGCRRGWSVLEASLRYNVPPPAVCGGRARCSTCRIRVIGDCSALPEPSGREAFVLNRVSAGADPSIRLACQLRPVADLVVLPDFPAADCKRRCDTDVPRIVSARSAIWSACSWTCAARPSWRKSGCRSIRSSSSTGSSARSRKRWSNAAASPTSSSAMDSWRYSASAAIQRPRAVRRSEPRP